MPTAMATSRTAWPVVSVGRFTRSGGGSGKLDTRCPFDVRRQLQLNWPTHHQPTITAAGAIPNLDGILAGQGEARQPTQHLLEHHGEFQAGQRGTHAAVDALAEPDVAVAVPTQPELLRLGELCRVP